MRKIPLLAFIIVSASLLSGSYHQTSAIGIDSSSHGLLYGGRVVRRYGSDKNLFNKRYPIGLRARADPADPNPPAKGAKGNNPDQAPQGKDAPKAAKGVDPNAADNPKGDPKGADNPKGDPKGADNPKAKNPAPVAPPAPPAPPAKAKDDNKPKQAKATPNQKSPPSPPPPPSEPADSDTTTPNTANTVEQNQPPPTAESQAGTPTVATGGLSGGAVAGLASIGGVFVLVAGLFAFGQRKKNKEMTKNIVSTSAKAWEQQNSTYEKMEDQAEPIGSFTVIATYTPTLADELDIQPGDKVTILVEFDDGWVQGINETRGGTKGVFPRHCVDMDNNASNKNFKRSSSMGVYSEKYTEVDLS